MTQHALRFVKIYVLWMQGPRIVAATRYYPGSEFHDTARNTANGTASGNSANNASNYLANSNASQGCGCATGSGGCCNGSGTNCDDSDSGNNTHDETI